MIFSIDRFEGDVAVLCNEEEACITVPCASLPVDATAGDMLRQTAEGYVIDRELTEARREHIRALQQRLKNRKR